MGVASETIAYSETVIKWETFHSNKIILLKQTWNAEPAGLNWV